MVWFGQLDIPDPVVQAHRDGNLIIFVGAGASVAPPSNLPLFDGLTNRILREAGATAAAAGADLSELLGRLKDERGIDVAERVEAHLGAHDSQPNALHAAIAQLAKAGTCRVVTTNYDRHLTTALAAEGVQFEDWYAPALPMGDDFIGLVYLHGALNRPQRRLVVTDQDFGQAYLSDAWATRFLERMFRQFTVLFVGYSHNDVIMKYLGRGLRGDAGRWMVTDRPDSRMLDRLGITAIEYASDGADHTKLSGGLARWAAAAGRGLLEHRELLRELLTTRPGLMTAEELSYLEATFADGTRTQLFTQVATEFIDAAHAEDWLNLVTGSAAGRSLFEPSRGGEPSWHLARWLAEVYVNHPDRSALVLADLHRNRRQLGPDLWWNIGRALWFAESPRHPWATPWILLLLRDAPPTDRSGHVERLLLKAELPDERSLVLVALEHLLRPVPALRNMLGDPAKMQVHFRFDHYEMNRSIDTTVRPQLDLLAADLAVIVENHLTLAHDILSASGSAGRTFDPLSFSRSAIDPDEQDKYPEDVDVLIDAARDSLAYLLGSDLTRAVSCIEAWIGSEVPLLRRIAVHGTNHRSDMTPSQKLQWIHDRELLWDFHGQHEVFRLLADSVASAVPAEVDRLLTEIMSGPPLIDEDETDEGRESREYKIYNLLAWLAAHAPLQPAIRAALGSVQTAHPRWKSRERPDLHMYVTAGDRESRPLPITVDALHDLVVADPAAALSELADIRTQLAEHPNDVLAHTAEDSASALAAEHPVDGLLLMEADLADMNGFTSSILYGWRSAEITANLSDAISTRLAQIAVHRFVADIARMITSKIGGTGSAWLRSRPTRQLATAAWNLLNEDDMHSAMAGTLLIESLNSVPGALAEYWYEVFIDNWQQTQDAWSGLPSDIRAALDQTITTGPKRAQLLALAYYVSRIHVFWSADRIWAKDHLLPLLDWTADQDRASRFWPAYLMGGRPNEQMLMAGLLDNYLVAAQHLPVAADDRDDVERSMAAHLASITMRSAMALESSGWLDALTMNIPRQRHIAWITAIAEQLRVGPDGDAEQQWAAWLHRYVHGRVHALPRALEADEASALVEIVVQLDQSYPDAVALIEPTPAGLNREWLVLDHLAKTKADSYPEATAGLLLRLLAETSPGQLHDTPSLQTIIRKLEGKIPADIVRRLREHVAGLGYPDALDW